MFANVAFEYYAEAIGRGESVEFIGNVRSHDDTFLRLACHLWWRAKQLGVECSLETVVSNGKYELPPVASAYLSLGDEPQQLRDFSIFDIPRIPPREEFRRLCDEYND